MKYTYVLLFLLAGSFLGFGQAPSDEPAELVSARARYTQEADAGIATIKQRYLAGLDLMKRAFGAKGNVNDALAVQKEIDRVAAGKEGAGAKLGTAATCATCHKEHKG